VFVIGTSLVVHPFAALPGYTLPSKPRILLNNDPVDDFNRPNDAWIAGDCDESVWKLCRKLGWHKDLRKLHKKIGGISKDWDPEIADSEDSTEETEETVTEDTVAQLTKELERDLKLDKEEDVNLRKAEEIVDKGDDTVLKSETRDDQHVVIETKDGDTKPATELS
jgi:NAD-dependent histone deacetylase SIR2